MWRDVWASSSTADNILLVNEAPCLWFKSIFYRVTLCVSAVFAVTRCPSVCPSVTFVHSIETAEDIVKLLCRNGSPIKLVFWLSAPVPNSKANPFSGRAKYKWWEKFAIFDSGTKLLQYANRKPYPVYRMVPLSMTLIDPDRDFKVAIYYFSTLNINDTR